MEKVIGDLNALTDCNDSNILSLFTKSCFHVLIWQHAGAEYSVATNVTTSALAWSVVDIESRAAILDVL